MVAVLGGSVLLPVVLPFYNQMFMSHYSGGEGCAVELSFWIISV